jgi:hypothetical protein
MTYTTEELIVILDSLPMAVIVVDADRKVIQVNSPTLEFIGKTVEDVLGRMGGDAFNCPHINDHPDGCGHGPKCVGCDLKNAVVTTLDTGKSIKRLDISMVLIDNKTHDLTITTNLATLQDKKVVLLAIEDITDRKKREEFKIKQMQLTTALETIGGLTHELAQPLMVILGYSGILKEAFEDTEYIKEVDAIYKSSLRLKGIINDLQHIFDYKSKGYANGKIIDISASSRKEGN